jgi:hypothetical protein
MPVRTALAHRRAERPPEQAKLLCWNAASQAARDSMSRQQRATAAGNDRAAGLERSGRAEIPLHSGPADEIMRAVSTQGGTSMIRGAHFLLYSRDAVADRRFLHDILGFTGVDAGGGWLILALPPSEIAVHPAEENFAQTHAGHAVLGAVMYLMCDDLHATIGMLKEKGVAVTEVQTADWGTATTMRLPGGGELGLYQPAHPSPLFG